jgi:site-specific recombinase XerD
MKREAKKCRGVYEKVPGSEVYWIRYADSNGRIRREKVGNKGAAIKLYAKRKTEVMQGVKLPENFRAKAVAFGELAEAALGYSKAHKSDYRHDDSRMKSVLETFRNRVAETITPQEIERWLSDEAGDKNWSPATVNRYKALFSLTFRIGVESGKVKHNPARLVKRRREDNARIRWLLPEEEKRLRGAIDAKWPEHLPELDIALHTGMRRSEQYSLMWSDVDFPNRIVTVRRTKNGEVRHIRLNRTALLAFQTLFARSRGEGYVFTNSQLEHLLNSRHWFEPAVIEAGIADFTWHCLRHTFASRLVMAGVDLRTVQQLMGHKTIQMTCRYAHLAPEHQLAAVERLCETENAQKEATDTRTDTKAKTTDASEVALVH